MSNPFIDRILKQGSTGHGNRSESRVAKSLSAQLRPASGALKGAKGDLLLPEFLVEAKSTVSDSLSVKLSWMVKITIESLNIGKTPALAISFVTPEGKAKPHGDWVAIPLTTFQELTEK